MNDINWYSNKTKYLKKEERPLKQENKLKYIKERGNLRPLNQENKLNSSLVV